MIRAVVALLTMTAFLIGPAETLIADVHDGHVVGGGASGSVSNLPTGGGSPVGALPSAPERSAGHEKHVDHCSHVHGPGLPATSSLDLLLPDGVSSPASSEPRFQELATPPLDRPPIS